MGRDRRATGESCAREPRRRQLRLRSAIPPNAVIVAVTSDWHELTTCYNCAYRLWPDHAPPGYLRPRNGADFPLRRECPHLPGAGRDPAVCPICTPPVGGSAAATPEADGPTDGLGVLRRWIIPTPYAVARCGACGLPIPAGELITIEDEDGVVHARCSATSDALG